MEKSLTLKNQIADLCQQADCSKKIAKIHLRQYVHGNWNPHPPKRFLSWWNKDGIVQTEHATDRAWIGIDAVRAFNCEAVRVVYREAVNHSPSATQTIANPLCQEDIGGLLLR